MLTGKNKTVTIGFNTYGKKPNRNDRVHTYRKKQDRNDWIQYLREKNKP